MKIKRVLSFLLATSFIFTFSVTAFAENSNEILNNAFYIDLPDDFENNSFYNSEYYDYRNYNNENQIFISVKENTTIDNMNEDFNVAKLIFTSFLYESSFLRENELVFSKSEVAKINRCNVAVFEAYYESVDIYEGTTYFRAFLFANKSFTYCIIATSRDKSFLWLESTIKSFRMNGILLEGDNQKNNIDFNGAEDYKQQLENYGDVYSNYEETASGVVFMISVIAIIPFFAILILSIFFIFKYYKNKKILTQYEKTFGILPNDMMNFTYNQNYGEFNQPEGFLNNQNSSQPFMGEENKK
ncbi:MAG: hypothetical protein IKC01_09125 [Clostridia bacterium]|nr:hypothetical protein [Clostridia bacterium]